MKLSYGIGIALLAVTSWAQAGSAVIRNGGQSGTSELEYRGTELLRMTTDKHGYMLNRKGTLYFVSGKPGQETVMESSSMMSMFKGNVPSSGPSPVTLKNLEKTGRRESVAGIKGDIWKMTFINEKGKTEETELVLSSKKSVVELRDAMHGLTIALLKSVGKDSDVKASEKMMDELRSRGLGILRFGDDMEIISLSSESIPKSRFDLPAEPMQVPNFSNLLGGLKQAPQANSGSAAASSQDENGSENTAAGDYAKEKAERQEDRVKNRADDEVDKATDKAVDKAIDKVFGKLFGG